MTIDPKTPAHDDPATQAFDRYWRDQAEQLLGAPCVIRAFAPRLHQGWELDEWAWLVDAGGATVLLTTSHGSLCTMEPDQLVQDVEKYKQAQLAAGELLKALDRNPS